MFFQVFVHVSERLCSNCGHIAVPFMALLSSFVTVSRSSFFLWFMKRKIFHSRRDDLRLESLITDQSRPKSALFHRFDFALVLPIDGSIITFENEIASQHSRLPRARELCVG
jgi:hypothetical protein